MKENSESELDKKIASKLELYRGVAESINKALSAPEVSGWLKPSFIYLCIGIAGVGVVSYFAGGVHLGASALVFLPCFALSVLSFVKAINDAKAKISSKKDPP